MTKHVRWSRFYMVLAMCLAAAFARSPVVLPSPGWPGGLVAHADELPSAEASTTQGALSGESGSGPTAWPQWLEPRGINVAELVGQVPEEYLHGMILSYEVGIVVYESGVRNGDTAVVTTTIYPRVIPDDSQPSHRLTIFGCIGQPPALDHMGSIFADSTMRVYRMDGTEITSQIIDFYQTHYMGTALPLAGSGQTARYPKFNHNFGVSGQEPAAAVSIPTNSGCDFFVGGNEYPLKGVFTFALDPALHASVLGVQQAISHSYIGPGDMGIFQPLMSQMWGRYGVRDDRIPLAIPPGANYFILRFPPMPGDYYTDKGRGTYENASRPSGGTYRLAGDGPILSADLTTSTAFPVQVAWQDQDQAPGTVYLPRITHPARLAPPEYLIPAGISYNSCFTQGNCPDYLLDQIYNTHTSLQILYLSVTKSGTDGQWLPLRMAGPAWVPGMNGAPGDPVSDLSSLTGSGATPFDAVPAFPISHRMYLPYIANSPPPTTGCPCGWFDTMGRMLTYAESSP